MNRHTLTGALLLALLLASAGCRGMESGNRPIHPLLNMDFQERFEEQEANDFFENRMAMRAPVPGTVAKGFLRDDVRFYSGQTEEGQYVERVPVPVTQELLERGRERYDIFCSVCHGQAGFGQGVIMTGDYGYTPAPTYHQETLRDTADGYLYEVVANGVRNMPGYAAQIPVADRWAIVAYIRALQRSQNAQRENVPPSVLARIEQTGSANMNAARNPAGPAATGGGGGGGGGNAQPSADTAAATQADTAAAQAPPQGGNGAPAEEAAAQETTATQEAAPAGTTAAAAASGAADDPPGADTAAMDTASARTAVAGGANVTESTPGDEGSAAAAGEDAATGEDTAEDTAAGEDPAESAGGDAAAGEGAAAGGGGEDAGGSIFGSTFFVILLVVLPILALTTMLVVAFRKDRDH